MNMIAFLRQEPRLLAFGFFAAFFSSFGQTFFISLSGAEIRGAYGLSHGDFGLVYMGATLTSAALLIWAGRKIDDMDLRLYTVLTLGGLALACLGMAMVEHVILLGLVIFGDWPAWQTFVGAGVIMASGLYVFYREQQQLRKGKAES